MFFSRRRPAFSLSVSRRVLWTGALSLAALAAGAQTDTVRQNALGPRSDAKGPAKWYEKISLRGYLQVRYNRLLETNPALKCEQCDRSIGDGGGLFIRRMRLIVFGQISERIYFYIQPDFASAPIGSSGLQLFGQLRDAYMDIGLDKKNEYRIRLGQSKIPYGFENMQSSQNRIPLDRADGTNSALPNERDLAAIVYWAPQGIRRRFASLVNDGYKGSGDYGVAGFGVFNGQTANRLEQNNNLHVVGRVSYPFQIGSQVLEPGLQGYTGFYTVATDQVNAGTKVSPDRTYGDRRVAVSTVLYPRPFGIQAEYNWGTGPQFNTATDSIENKPLHGGYVTLSYFLKLKNHILFPFVRLQNYEGGKKQETDARAYHVREAEVGVEWQPMRAFELTAMYTFSKRRFEDFRQQSNLQSGQLLRLQAQLNF